MADFVQKGFNENPEFDQTFLWVLSNIWGMKKVCLSMCDLFVNKI